MLQHDCKAARSSQEEKGALCLSDSLWIRRHTAEIDIDVIKETISQSSYFPVPDCTGKTSGCSFNGDKG